jgi:Nucleotidyl transferase AbiEii toxin, Type IV TA system
MPEFLHDRRDFGQLIAVVADERRIDPVLVEKDYWIMHCLWGLQAQGLRFELKGGTSLSKGFGIIHRFSEDIDIRIEPPQGLPVKTGRNQDKPAHVASRSTYYDWLTREINIPGVLSNERDTAFDDEKLRSAGIRLVYPTSNKAMQGIKSGILLELGFDDTAPNRPVTISSWAYDKAVASQVQIVDNRAVDVLCYAPTHTFVEKLQTISTKYRRLAESSGFPANFLRHYYDVYCLLALPEIQAFIGQLPYEERKQQRFRTGDERVIAQNPAFLLEDAVERQRFIAEYQKTASLYYQGQPDFEAILARIHQHILKL